MTARPRWAATPELSVFVNCPHDPGFRGSLDAIVFTCVHAGFLPWMAGSTGSTAVARVQRILEGLASCRYSIHDLTRYQGEGLQNVSRFNMPLELGMAMALRGHQPASEAHDWTVMVPDGMSTSDMSRTSLGLIRSRMTVPARVATSVLAWLMTRPTVEEVVAPDDVVPKLPEYSARKRTLDESWAASPPWGLVIDLAIEVARSRPA